MSKMLVKGGAGFIGSHLVDRLIEEGHEVCVLDNLVSGDRKNINPKAQFIDVDIRNLGGEGDQSCWRPGLIYYIRNFNAEYVFHLAAVSRTPWAIQEPQNTYSSNVVGSSKVLEASLSSSVKKVVLASSNIVYAAQTPYKTSKLAMEGVARDYNDLYGLPTLCLRFSNVYGAVGDTPLRQHPDNVLMALSESKRKNGYITIFGDGDKIKRNFTHVSDICDALITAMGSDVRGNEIDIMHPRAWTLNEVAKLYDCEVRYTDERKGDIQSLDMSGPEKAKELLNFEATMKLEDNIYPYINV